LIGTIIVDEDDDLDLAPTELRRDRRVRIAGVGSRDCALTDRPLTVEYRRRRCVQGAQA
jgi:hypothetical protein